MTYGTEMEKKLIEIIKNHFPDYEIVNPNIPEHQDRCRESIGGDPTPGKEIGYFLKLTDDTDIGCFFSYYKPLWSAGSAAEANYMLNCGKRVFVIDNLANSVEEIHEKVESFTFAETVEKLSNVGLTEYM